MNIGEAAACAGVTAKMARHYESLGLLLNFHGTNSGYGVYSENEVHTQRFINRSRDMGSRWPTSPSCSHFGKTPRARAPA